MAAECENEDRGVLCGVQALGRCPNPECHVQGGAAFCSSHVERRHGRRRDWCLRCSRAADRWLLEIEEAKDRARDRIRALAHALVAAGAGPDEQYFHATTTELIGFLKFFGVWKYRTRDNPDGHRYGWYIGTYDWYLEEPIRDARFDSGGISQHITFYHTFVTQGGDIAPQGGRRGRLAGLDLYDRSLTTRTRDFLDTGAAEMSRLAQARGVEIE
ncbi:hypothetical protein AGRA3207_007300 [Actinomadura graeca]|uniref:Uncharacterized protein n=1 Tax=Actinomadura graeca TaxID=2750812 RepID=A0ABX8R4J4_9ACTN|nr:hypothetical protein [Actinomadura graeca]QXJ25758.1 hypothetical protein AGRA3207_007300 [Actinomadura graeca]